jgi:hypothetical protein
MLSEKQLLAWCNLVGSEGKLTFDNQDPDLGVWLDVATFCNVFLLLGWRIVVVLQCAFLGRACGNFDKEPEC